MREREDWAGKKSQLAPSTDEDMKAILKMRRGGKLKLSKKKALSEAT